MGGFQFSALTNNSNVSAPAVAVPNGSIGLVQTTGEQTRTLGLKNTITTTFFLGTGTIVTTDPDLGDMFFNFPNTAATGVGSTANPAVIGGDIQTVDCFGNLVAKLLANGNIGNIIAGSMVPTTTGTFGTVSFREFVPVQTIRIKACRRESDIGRVIP